MKKNRIIRVISLGMMLTAFSVYAEESKVQTSPQRVQQPAQPQQQEPVVQLSSVDINTADEDTLAALKGLGPKKAEAIIAYRKAHGPFKSLDELSSVRGLGEKSVERLIKSNLDTRKETS